jgi:hypothetical protein
MLVYHKGKFKRDVCKVCIADLIPRMFNIRFATYLSGRINKKVLNDQVKSI